MAISKIKKRLIIVLSIGVFFSTWSLGIGYEIFINDPVLSYALSVVIAFTGLCIILICSAISWVFILKIKKFIKDGE
jgi:hypothetical protein